MKERAIKTAINVFFFDCFSNCFAKISFNHGVQDTQRDTLCLVPSNKCQKYPLLPQNNHS